MIDDLLGLHATDRRSPYLQLRARVAGFTPDELDELLDAGRAARVPGMRSTLFIESAAMVELVMAATRGMLAAGHERWLAANGLTRRSYEQLALRIEDALGGGPLDARRLREAIGAREQLTPVLVVMCDEARLVRWKGGRGWPHSPPAYRRFAEALPGVEPDAWDEEAAMRELVARYVRRYGPVTERDVAWWTGFRMTEVRRLLAALPDLVAAAIDGQAVLLHVDDVAAAQRRPRALTGEVALLPLLDPYVQGYRDRDRLVEPAHLPFVVDPAGNATSAIVAAGRVAGVWDRVGTEVRLFLFGAPSAALRKRVRAAAAGLAPVVVEVGRMLPLSAPGTGGAAAPLKDAV